MRVQRRMKGNRLPQCGLSLPHSPAVSPLINLAYCQRRTPFCWNELWWQWRHRSTFRRAQTHFSLSLDMTCSSWCCFICCRWSKLHGNFLVLSCAWTHRKFYKWMCVCVMCAVGAEHTDCTVELTGWCLSVCATRRAHGADRAEWPLHCRERPWTELSLWLTVMIGGGNGCLEGCEEDEGHVCPIWRGDTPHACLL